MFSAQRLASLWVAALAPLLMAATPECDELMRRAAEELRREQYPTMLSVALERARACPGPNSSFLVGLAQANMLDRQLVPEAEQALVREQAIAALEDALASEKWRSTAEIWLRNLKEQPSVGASGARAPAGSIELAPTRKLARHRAAPPFEPDRFPWGPVLLGSAGGLMLSAALVTGLMGHSRDAEIRRAAQACAGPACMFAPQERIELLRLQDQISTFYAVTNVLLVVGGITTASSVVWYFLRPTPSEHEVSVLPYVERGGAGARVVGRF
jgi:hypothetical protein